MEGLDCYLESELGLATVMGDPLKSILVNQRLANKEELSRLGPMFAVGIGLALREVVD
jgi:Tfp pilus assembly PilM family ATPase